MSDTKQSPVASAWSGVFQFLGIFLAAVVGLFIFGPLLGLTNAGIANVNSTFAETPQLITAFGVTFNLAFMAITRLLINALILSFIVWLVIKGFRALFGGGGGHAAAGHH